MKHFSICLWFLLCLGACQCFPYEACNATPGKTQTVEPAQLTIPWRPVDGWLSLVPGKSTLKDVTAELGEPEARDEILNGSQYYFRNRSIIITIGKEREKITWIHVMSQDPALMPQTLDDAQKRYGQLEVVQVKKNGEVWHSRPGISVVCNSAPKKNLDVLWMEFYNALPADLAPERDKIQTKH